MTKQKIAIHLIIWGIIGAGVLLSFWIFPAASILTFNVSPALFIFPFAIYFLYYLISTIAVKISLSASPIKTDRMILAGVYGKFSHPVCTTLAILSWAVFLLVPTIEILVSAIWTTLIVYSTIKLEEKMLLKKREAENSEESDSE